jgi:hypothetical protein
VLAAEDDEVISTYLAIYADRTKEQKGHRDGGRDVLAG